MTTGRPHWASIATRTCAVAIAQRDFSAIEFVWIAVRVARIALAVGGLGVIALTASTISLLIEGPLRSTATAEQRSRSAPPLRESWADGSCGSRAAASSLRTDGRGTS